MRWWNWKLLVVPHPFHSIAISGIPWKVLLYLITFIVFLHCVVPKIKQNFLHRWREPYICWRTDRIYTANLLHYNFISASWNFSQNRIYITNPHDTLLREHYICQYKHLGVTWCPTSNAKKRCFRLYPLVQSRSGYRSLLPILREHTSFYSICWTLAWSLKFSLTDNVAYGSSTTDTEIIYRWNRSAKSVDKNTTFS